MKILGNVLKGVIALAMIAAVIAVGVFLFNIELPFGGASSSASDDLGKQVMFTVQPGDTVDTIGEHLQQQKIIDSPMLFNLQVKMKGVEAELKAGQFQLTTGMEMDKLITALTTPPTELALKFQVIEGWRVEEIAEKLAGKGVVDSAKFVQLVGTAQESSAYESDFLKAAGRPEGAGLEGYLFPDTYEIKQSSEADNSDTVIRIMLSTMEEKFTPEMRKTLADKGQSIHEALTIASIVQREGQKKDELPRIAGVFWNRIAQGMRLDADPTTQYAVGKAGDWWPLLNLSPGDVENPYNTYTIQGLPPGPICNPGLDAIKAAIDPEETDYLFFVAKNDPNDPGAHLFAETLEEHEQNRIDVGNR